MNLLGWMLLIAISFIPYYLLGLAGGHGRRAVGHVKDPAPAAALKMLLVTLLAIGFVFSSIWADYLLDGFFIVDDEPTTRHIYWIGLVLFGFIAVVSGLLAMVASNMKKEHFAHQGP